MSIRMKEVRKKEPSLFLRLPLELRQQIYRDLLPRTFDAQTSTLRTTPLGDGSHTLSLGNALSLAGDNRPFGCRLRSRRSNSSTNLLKEFKSPPVNCTLWQLGSTAILATNRQINAEASDVLYGENIFSLTVSYDRIQFHFAWQTENGLQPRRSYDLLRILSVDSIRKIRSFVIAVSYLNSYMSTVKYNCGSAGQTAGLIGQVEKLVRVIQGNDHERRLRNLDIRNSSTSNWQARTIDPEDSIPSAQIFEPFGRLKAFQASVTDVIGEQFARELEHRIVSDVSDCKRVPTRRDAANGSTEFMDLKSRIWKDLKEPIAPAGYYPMPAARLQGFNEI